MPEIVLDCRQCGRALRVPEDLLGRLVKCPVCGLTFSVPAGAAEPQPVSPVPEAPEMEIPSHLPTQEDYGSTEHEPGEEQPHRDHDRVRALPTPPAIFLFLAGIFGLLANVAEALYVAARLRFPAPAPAQPPRDFLEELQQEIAQGATGPMPIVIAAVFGVVSILIMIAGIQMLRQRTYAFVIAGSVLAMVNVNNCCCLLGLPAGIWALVILSKPEVRSAFP